MGRRKAVTTSQLEAEETVELDCGNRGKWNVSKFLKGVILSNLKRIGYDRPSGEQVFFIYSRIRTSEQEKDFQKIVDLACERLEEGERRGGLCSEIEDARRMWGRMAYLLFGRQDADHPKDEGMQDAKTYLHNAWDSFKPLVRG